MGFVDSIARFFGFGGGTLAAQTPGGAQATQTIATAAQRPIRVNEIKPHPAAKVPDTSAMAVATNGHAGGHAAGQAGDIDDELEGFTTPSRGSLSMPMPKNRGELVEELRKNYAEVLGLVRKVDGHLDEQTRRSERLLEVAESASRNAELLPQISAQNERMADAITDLAAAVREGREQAAAATDRLGERLGKTAIQQLESLQHQTSALQQMQSAVVKAGEAEAKMAGSIDAFGHTLGGMTKATEDLGMTISAMRETDAERERELAELVSRSQRWLIGIAAVLAVLAAATFAAVLTGRV